jgi:hypothetical protein
VMSCEFFKQVRNVVVVDRHCSSIPKKFEVSHST